MRKLGDNKIQKTAPPKEIIEPFIQQKDSLNISTYILKKVVEKLRQYRLIYLPRDTSVYFHKIEELKNTQEKIFVKHLVINNNSEPFKTILLFYKNLQTLKIINSSFVDFCYFKNSPIKKLILENVKHFKYEKEIKEIEFVNFVNTEILKNLIFTYSKNIKILKLNKTKTDLQSLNKIMRIKNFISFYNQATEESILSFLKNNTELNFFHFLENDFEIFFMQKLEFIFFVNNFTINFIPVETEFLILQNTDISFLLEYFPSLKQLRKIIIRNCIFSFNDFIEFLQGKEIIHLSLENIKFSFSSINKLIQTLKYNLRSLEILKSPLPNDFIDLITNNLQNCKVVYGENQEIIIV